MKSRAKISKVLLLLILAIFLGLMEINIAGIVAYADSVQVKALSGSSYHTLTLLTDGTVKAFGRNNYGQLGLGDIIDRVTPTLIPGLTGVKQVITSSSGDQSFALMDDGSVKAWGYNNYGQLGLGDTSNRNTPTTIPNLSGVSQLAVGGSHTFALLNDGTVKAWGYNYYGQLGLGTTTSKNTPTVVTSLTGVKQISAGFNHTLALMNDGTVKAWGYNLYGQLGVGDLKDKTVPTAIVGLTGVSQLVASYNQTLALMNDGSVKAWGYNWVGQLGLGDTTNRNTPASVPGLAGVKQIAAGNYHSIALMNDGTMKSAGYNTNGQLGMGDTAQRNLFTSVSTLSGVSQVGAGMTHSLALLNDGKVKAWGENTYSQLGLLSLTKATAPTTTSFSPPVINLSQNTLLPTNKNVTITTSFADSSIIALTKWAAGNQNISYFAAQGTTFSNSFIVDVNGTYTVYAKDTSGNESVAVITVSNIDKILPVITIAPYNTNPTNQDITVTATTNEGTLNAESYTFSANGSFTFIATDPAGNVSNKTVNITNIDKVVPVITIAPYNTVPTNQDVTVVASTTKGTLNENSHTFTANGSFTFIATDAAGNTANKTVSITNIDKVAPVITVAPYNTAPTNQYVEVTAATNEGTLYQTSYIFTENGSFTFTAIDAVGNVANETVTITNIDKVAPVITLEPYNTDPTNQDVTVTATTNEGTLNENSHTFTENGSFTFTATDAAGNVSSKTVTVSNIDKVLPVITIAPYDTAPTSGEVTVTATTDKGTLNAGSHTFTENGSFTFTATDTAGNTASKTVTVTNIDKTAPVITIAAYNTAPTNKDIEVTAATNEGTLNRTSYVFTENGSFTFTAVDEVGNTSSKTVTITNIDKVAPVVTIAPYNTDPTNGDVTVTASTDKGTLSAESHTFTANGSFTFTATDAAGNVTSVTVTISNIDKVLPVITVAPYDTAPTNKDVTVTAAADKGSLNAESHTFTENGSFTFVAVDALGNTSSKTVTVTNIDKTPPVITIRNYSTNPTNQDITVTATTNEGTLNAESYTFAENGSFDFVATDAAGNITTKTVTITNIGKVPPMITIAPYNTRPTNQDVTVKATTNEGTLNAESHTFTENGSFTFTAADIYGNTASETVTITNIDRVAPSITIGQYNTEPTNQDVTVVAAANEGTLNENSHTFRENGSFTFTATDAAGNTASQTVTITNIDKTAPSITIGQYNTAPTNQDITVTATTDEGTLNAESHTFTENGSFTFTATDAVGNTATKTVTITNIGKTPPVITVAPYTTAPTNQDVTVTASAGGAALNETSHTFTENGSFTFTATDIYGNTASETVTVTNIDRVVPVITINPYNENPTNQDITVTASTDKGTLDADSHTFTESGSFTFTATDAAGNTASRTVTVTNIDKAAPVITIGQYNTAPTNQDITVTATTNEGTLEEESYTFAENGSFTFTATDAAGNVATKTVTVDNIDRVAPIITVDSYNTIPTNQDVTITATTDEGTLNEASHTFTENGSFTFIATDAAGNVTEKTITVSNIDKVAPVITVAPYNTAPTNKSVTVTVTTNEGGLNAESHVFAENGSFTFTATDEAGNVGSVEVAITNIDKIPPVITIAPYTTAPTNKDVVVTATSDEGKLNAESYTFTKNGSFTFTATDGAGNVSNETVTVTNIDKVAPVITIAPYETEPTNQDVIVMASADEGTLNAKTHTFTENGSFTFTATDAAGNVTNKTVTVTNIDKVLPVITIAPYNTAPTNQDITVTATTSKGTLNAKSHTFTENGSFTFTAVDAVGNTASETVLITNIDKTPPIITIKGYTTDPTNQDITVTAATNEGTLNTESHTFTENGSFDFIATDSAGNKAVKTVTITNIGKLAPIITIAPYNTNPTNKDITVTASTNTGRLNATSHTFTQNGSFTFTATDVYGNKASETVTITNIDKTAPVITINPYELGPTNQDITVVAVTNEGTLNENSHTFTQNGSFTFTATDVAGNTASKTVTITNIDNTAPVITIGKYTTAPTNQDVTVTATTNEGTLNAASHIFTQNGSFTFTATDAAGNVTSQTVTVSNIDKVAPVITVDSYNTSPTNQNVTITVTANEGTLNAASHTFTENGSFTFTATDAAGNVTNKVVTVANIDKVAPVITIAPYSTAPTTQSITVTATANEGTLNATSHTFTENGSFTFTATDSAGNITSKEVVITNISKAMLVELRVKPEDILLRDNANRGIVRVTVVFPQGAKVKSIDIHSVKLNGKYSPILGILSFVTDLNRDGKMEVNLIFKKRDFVDALLDSNGNITITGKSNLSDFTGSYTDDNVIIIKQLQSVEEDIKDSNLKKNVKNELIIRLESVIRSIERHQEKKAITKLKSFVDRVDDMDPRYLSENEANSLMKDVQDILDLMAD